VVARPAQAHFCWVPLAFSVSRAGWLFQLTCESNWSSLPVMSCICMWWAANSYLSASKTLSQSSAVSAQRSRDRDSWLRSCLLNAAWLRPSNDGKKMLNLPAPSDHSTEDVRCHLETVAVSL
jgi:hypothetical protein